MQLRDNQGCRGWFLIMMVSGLGSVSLPGQADDLGELRKQLQEQHRVLERLERKIEELEKSRAVVGKPSASSGSIPVETAAPAVVAGPFKNAIQLPNGTAMAWGGYVKLDAIYNDYAAIMQVGDDTLAGALISLEGTAEHRRHKLNIHAKESRFGFETRTPTAWGELSTQLQLDFFVSDQGNERNSNSYAPRLRHAYAKMDNWLLGQTWSTFQILESGNETNDFTGAISEVFARQGQIRYTHPFEWGNVQVALENPETSLESIEGQRIYVSHDRWPDTVMRLNWLGAQHMTSVAVILRNLRAVGSFGNISVDDEVWAPGISVGGQVTVGPRDYVTWQINYGMIGRYVGINHTADGSFGWQGELSPTFLSAFKMGYQHGWTSNLRSTLLFGYVEADYEEDNVLEKVNHRFWSTHANLMWSLAPTVRLGIEYLHAHRELRSGQEGALNRLQFSGQYVF